MSNVQEAHRPPQTEIECVLSASDSYTRQCAAADSVEHRIHAMAACFLSAGSRKVKPYLPSAKIFARHSIVIAVE